MTAVHHASLIRTTSVNDFEVGSLSSDAEIYDTYFESFGIDDARNLIVSAYHRPLETKTQVLIVRTDFITLEAQNALLKLLEEPPVSTKLIFILPKDLILLETLKSRLQTDDLGVNEVAEANVIFLDFLSLDYKSRIELIEQATKNKNVTWQRAIKKGLLDYLRHSSTQELPLIELEYVVRNLLTRGASNKMLLEHVALILPARLAL